MLPVLYNAYVTMARSLCLSRTQTLHALSSSLRADFYDSVWFFGSGYVISARASAVPSFRSSSWTVRD